MIVLILIVVLAMVDAVFLSPRVRSPRDDLHWTGWLHL